MAALLHPRVGTVKATRHKALRKMRLELQGTPIDGLPTAAREGIQSR
ncbi:hypothetical protein AB0J94_06815 [Micromonospora noduli]|nr:hypothetical protein [Micromonospora noduli]RAO21399.1 hypothetical protein LUPAC07_01216 [Micromonospora noduli]